MKDKRFTVFLQETIVQEATVQVNARNNEEAEAKALATAQAAGALSVVEELSSIDAKAVEVCLV